MSAHTFNPESSYSRFPAKTVSRPVDRPAAKATRGQTFLEYGLFAVFGATILLAGVALYATNTPEHNSVPNHFAAGLAENRVNILLIGTTTRERSGGAPDITTQSLQMLSVQPSTGRAVLATIPSDLWVKVGHYGTRPLRTAYMVGDASGYPGAGSGLTVDTVQKVLGQPIHAYARIDLGDLRRTIDTIGGVDVQVTRGVYEYKHKLRFRPGQQHLSGVHTLRYAWSPYVMGPARERFEREARQQQVVAAALEKISRHHDARVFEQAFGENSATNLSNDQIALVHQALRRGGELATLSFQPYMSVVDVTSVAYRGKAVTPRGGDFTTMQKVASAMFESGVARVQ